MRPPRGVAAGHSHMHKDSVIPSEAARFGAVYSAFGGAVERPFLLKLQQERSLHDAVLRAAPVGMTEIFPMCECPGCCRVKRLCWAWLPCNASVHMCHQVSTGGH